MTTKNEKIIIGADCYHHNDNLRSAGFPGRVSLSDIDVDVYLHRDIKSDHIRVEDNVCKPNADIILTHGLTEYPELPGVSIVKLKRHGKAKQQARLTDIYQSTGFKDLQLFNKLQAVATYSVDRESNHVHGDIADWVVLKPEHGARGMYQYLINAANLNPIQVYKYLLESETVRTPEEIATKFGTVDLKMGNNEKLRKEEINMNIWENQNAVLQSFVPDIEVELRVLFSLTRYGTPLLYIQRRDMNDADFRQATGSHGTGDDCIYWQCHNGCLVPQTVENKPQCDKLPVNIEHLVEFLEQLVPHLDTLIGSIDIALTKEGQIYVLEYQPQFGTLGVPLGVVHRLHRYFLEYIIYDHLDRLKVIKGDRE